MENSQAVDPNSQQHTLDQLQQEEETLKVYASTGLCVCGFMHYDFLGIASPVVACTEELEAG